MESAKAEVVGMSMKPVKLKILMAHYLWQRNISTKQIAAALQFWADPTKKEKKEAEIDIREINRAQVLLGGRLLGVIFGLVTEMDALPKDCILICHELDENNDYKADEYLRVLQSRPQFGQENILFGYVKDIPEGEILTRIKDFRDFVEIMEGRQYYGIRIPENNHSGHPVELLIGLDAAYLTNKP